MTHDSQSAHCPAHPCDYHCGVHIYNIRMSFEQSPGMAIMPELPHVTELRLRRTTPFRQITCSITSVWCKHEFLSLSPSLSPLVPCTGIGNRIDLIKRVQQETSRACCGFIRLGKIDVVLAKEFHKNVKPTERIATLDLWNIMQTHLNSFLSHSFPRRKPELKVKRKKNVDSRKI